VDEPLPHRIHAVSRKRLVRLAFRSDRAENGDLPKAGAQRTSST